MKKNKKNKSNLLQDLERLVLNELSFEGFRKKYNMTISIAFYYMNNYIEKYHPELWEKKELNIIDMNLDYNFYKSEKNMGKQNDYLYQEKLIKMFNK